MLCGAWGIPASQDFRGSKNEHVILRIGLKNMRIVQKYSKGCPWYDRWYPANDLTFKYEWLPCWIRTCVDDFDWNRVATEFHSKLQVCSQRYGGLQGKYHRRRYWVYGNKARHKGPLFGPKQLREVVLTKTMHKTFKPAKHPAARKQNLLRNWHSSLLFLV